MFDKANQDDAMDVLQAMLKLEKKGYTVETDEDLVDEFVGDDFSRLTPDSKRVGRWRAKMVDFCYEVAEYCMSDRETVSIAMSYLDRFLRTPAGLEVCQNQDLFKLAAMTCHYTTIKIHEPPAVPPEVISEMSLGAFSVEQAEDMEFVILQSIGWRVNPPTSYAFLRQFLYLIPAGIMTSDRKEAAYEAAVEQLDFALRDRHFVKDSQSHVAMSALLNALKVQCGDDTDKYVSIWSIVMKAANLDSRIVLNTTDRLKVLADSMEQDVESFDSTGSVDKFPCKRLFYGRSNSLQSIEVS